MTESEFVKLEQAAQRAAEQRLSDAYERWHAEQEQDGDVDVWSDFEGGAFCGCDTCVVREVLDAAWPYFEKLVDGMRELEAQAAQEVEER